MYLPITPMFHVHAGRPLYRHGDGRETDLSGAATYRLTLRLIQREQVTFPHCVPNPSCKCCSPVRS